MNNIPASLQIDAEAGRLAGRTGSYEKLIKDLSGVYQDASAFDALVDERGTSIAYRVEEFRRSEDEGDLIFGLSVLNAGKVGSEFAITRGHRHVKTDRSEIYVGVSGRGLLLLEDPAGVVDVVELSPGSIAYVPPHWIHRSVNTGDEDLVSLFCYPADSGQDYEIIEKNGGMGSLVVDDGSGRWALVDNPRYGLDRQ